MAQTASEIQRLIARYITRLKEMGVPVERVYLFGSQTGKNPGSESDVDLAVISPLFEKMSLWDKAGYLGRAAMDIPCPLDVLGFSPSQVKRAKPGTLLKHIINKGIEITPF